MDEQAAVAVEAAPPRRVVAPEASFRPGPIAVVAFVNVSGVESDDWVGAGMAETLSVSFEHLGVSVVGRGTLRDEAGTFGAAATACGQAVERALVEVSRDHGAAWLLTGEYRRLGDRLEVAAWLVDTTTGRVAARVAGDGAAGEIFALQDRIAEQLGGVFVALGRS